MASKRDTNYRRYTIPENFIESGRCFHGMFKTRGLIEGVILGGLAAFIAFLIPVKEIETRIPVIICITAPFFALGVSGINGDPLSVFLGYAYTWIRTKGVILYNGNTRFLDESPLDKMMEQTDLRDKIFDIVEKRRLAKEKANEGKTLVEGLNFEFGNDEDSMAVVVHPEFDDEDDDEEVYVVEDSEEDIGFHDADNSSMNEEKNRTASFDDDAENLQETKGKQNDGVVSMKLRIDLKNLGEEDLF